MKIQIIGEETYQGLFSSAEVEADTDEAVTMLSTALLDLCALNGLDAMELFKIYYGERKNNF